jgi:flavin reductase (DIM6/NTAB) family NADH-FMN oxidoreductase RutF
MTDATPALDTALFRRVMGRFATGVTVITAEAAGGVRGMTANAFMSGSLSPPLCVIAVARKARLHRALETSGRFGVSMLAQGQEAISRHFAGQGTAEPELLFEHIEGVPVLAQVCAALAAQVDARHDCGDHSLFVGRVLGLRAGERAPLVYQSGHYATLHVKRATSAEDAIDFWELDHGEDW